MAAIDLDGPEFDGMVADALEHLWDFSYLGSHPLAGLESVTRAVARAVDPSHLDRGRALCDLLVRAMDQLKPGKRQRDISRERMFSIILSRAYIDGIPNKQIAESLNIGDRTFYRYKANAIRVVARLLRDWEG